MNDATGDYGYLLKEAQDLMEWEIKESLYGAKANGTVLLDGRVRYTEKILFDATDITGAPDGTALALYVMERAMEGDVNARELVGKLIHAYAKANAIAPE